MGRLSGQLARSTVQYFKKLGSVYRLSEVMQRIDLIALAYKFKM